MADESLDEELTALLAEIEARNGAKYDGINGQPPEGLPQWHKDKFAKVRARVLGGRYKPDAATVLEWMDAIDAMHGNLDSRQYAPGFFPPDLREELTFLCEIRHLYWLGEAEGRRRVFGSTDPALWPVKTSVDESGRVLIVDKAGHAIGFDPAALRQIVERHLVGRYILEEVAAGLAERSGLGEGRWLDTIVQAVNSGELPLKNPRDLRDGLPYPVPDTLRTFYDQVHVGDVDKWLDSHPEYGVHRLGSKAQLITTPQAVAADVVGTGFLSGQLPEAAPTPATGAASNTAAEVGVAASASRTQIKSSEDVTLIGPEKKDDWFLAIQDMARAFHGEHGRLPNEAEAWARLFQNPPAGYGISSGKDKGKEVAVVMGGKPLAQSSFKKRWKRYTTPLTPKVGQ